MTMMSIQKELEDVKEVRQREAHQSKEEREELSILRDRCHRLEKENELRLQTVRVLSPKLSALLKHLKTG